MHAIFCSQPHQAYRVGYALIDKMHSARARLITVLVNSVVKDFSPLRIHRCCANKHPDFRWSNCYILPPQWPHRLSVGLHEKSAKQILCLLSFLWLNGPNRRVSKLPQPFSSASRTGMMSSKEATKLIKSPPSFQEQLSAGGETWCNHLYTVCESTLHREISEERPPDAWGLWRWEEEVGGGGAAGEGLEAAAANVYHITHTCTCTMLQTHFPRQLWWAKAIHAENC